MRVSTFLLAVAATFAAAQNFAGEPACATSCLSSAIVAIGCGLNDQGCQCGSSAQSALVVTAGGCLAGACNAADLNQALTVGQALCAAYSKGLANSTTTGSSGSGVTVTSSTASSTSTSTVIASTTSVPFPINGTTSSGTTGTNTGTNTGTITSKATTTTAATTGSKSSSAASSSSSVAGAGSNRAYAAGGVIGMVLGAFAIL